MKDDGTVHLSSSLLLFMMNVSHVNQGTYFLCNYLDWYGALNENQKTPLSLSLKVLSEMETTLHKLRSLINSLRVKNRVNFMCLCQFLMGILKWGRLWTSLWWLLDIVWFLLCSWWFCFCPCYPLLSFLAPLWSSPSPLPFLLSSQHAYPFIFCLSVSLWSLPVTRISGHSAQLGLFASYNYIENLSYMLLRTVANGIALHPNTHVFLECYSVFT